MAAMAKAIGSLLAREGMEFPVHSSTLCCNGSGHLCRHTLRSDGTPAPVEFLARHDEPTGWLLPMHALLLDSNGCTARVLVTEKRKGN
jgi:hypothetical protein